MLQVQLYEQIQKLHFNELVKAIGGDGVISGLEVTAAGGMDLNVSAGEAIIGGTRVSFSATTVTISAADPLYPRKDIVVAKSDGTIEVVQGTPDSPLPSDRTGVFTVTPRPPDPPSNSIVLAEVWVPAGATEITSAYITDRRIFVAPPGYLADKIYVDEIAEKTPGAGITLLNISKHQAGIQTDTISELTSGAGIDIGAGSLYVNQTLQMIRWKQKKYALYFNGENAYVEIQNDPVFNPSGSFTLEAYFNPAFLPPDERWRIFQRQGSTWGLFIRTSSRLEFYADTRGAGGSWKSVWWTLPSANRWYHVIGVYRLDNQMELWVDGELKATTSQSYKVNEGTLNPRVGADPEDKEFFQGLIGFIRYYDDELSEDEIAYNFNNPQSPITRNLKMWLNFDEGSGDVAYDKSGNGNHGTIYNCEWVEDEIYAGSMFPGNRFGLLYAAEIRQLGAGGINLGGGALFVDQANKRVGIGTTTPEQRLHVNGVIRSRWDVQINAGTSASGILHLRLMSGGSRRFGIGLVGDETGDNAGADLAVWRYADDGSYLGLALKVYRSSGDIYFCDQRIIMEQAGRVFRPNADNTGSIGTNSYRWALVRAVTVTQGDIGFGPEDQPCPICGKRFEVGDVVVLKVHKVLESGEFRAKPVHLSCAG